MERDIDVQAEQTALAIWAFGTGRTMEHAACDLPRRRVAGGAVHIANIWALADAIVAARRADAPLSIRFGRHTATVPDGAPSLDFLLACMAIGPIMKGAAGDGVSGAECAALAKEIVARLRSAREGV